MTATRAVLSLAVLALLVSAAFSLGRKTFAGRADFAFCNQSEVESLDPATASGASSGRILTALFEGLTRLDPRTLEPLPGVAESWDTSADGLTWRFRLRPDAHWSNGDPVTAHDFVYSFRRLLDPATGARAPYLLWAVEGAREFTSGNLHDDAPLGIVATSDRELVLRLVRPCPYLPQVLASTALLPVHRPTVEAHGHAWVKPGHLVGNGPFLLRDRRLRDRLRLERSPTYWGADEVALQTIDAYAAEGITTQLNLYLTGEVDWIVKPPPSLHDALSRRDDHRSGPQFGTTFLRFNTTRPPFDDPRVRHALLLALDRPSLARDILRGGQRPATSFVPPGVLAGYEPPALPPGDPTRARALLAQAGFPDGAGFPPFDLLYPHNETTRDICEAVAACWRTELGIDAHLVNQPFKVALDSTRRLLYDVSWGTWIGDHLDPSTFLEVFLSDSGNNRTGWTNPTYDALVTEAAGDLDPVQRAATYARAEALLLDELPLAPVYHRVNINLVGPRIAGWHDNPLDLHPLRDVRVLPTPP